MAKSAAVASSSESRPAPAEIAKYGVAVVDASRDFGLICDQLDAAEDDAAFRVLAAEFAETRALVEDKVDQYAELRELIRDQIKRDERRATSLRERAHRLKAMLSGADAKVLARIAADPDKGWTGKSYKLCRQANGGLAALKIALATKHGTPAVRDVSVSHVIDAETSLDIDDKFLTTTTHTVINTQAVRAAIEAGETLNWAKLERGYQLRAREL